MFEIETILAEEAESDSEKPLNSLSQSFEHLARLNHFHMCVSASFIVRPTDICRRTAYDINRI